MQWSFADCTKKVQEHTTNCCRIWFFRNPKSIYFLACGPSLPLYTYSFYTTALSLRPPCLPDSSAASELCLEVFRMRKLPQTKAKHMHGLQWLPEPEGSRFGLGGLALGFQDLGFGFMGPYDSILSRSGACLVKGTCVEGARLEEPF